MPGAPDKPTVARILPVAVSDSPVAEAWQAACRQHHPLFCPAQMYVDDRGWSVMNQLQGVLDPAGQVNYSLIHPGVVKAWHRHHRQSDFWLCLSGHIKAGICRDDGTAWQIVIGRQRPGVLIIPPTLWHGCATVGAEPAGLFYYVSRAYDPDHPDEQRLPYDALAGFAWQVQHR